MLSSSESDSAKAILIPLLLVVVALSWAWISRPSLYYTLATQVSSRLNGISTKTVQLSDHDVRLLVGKGSEPLLLLHEFTSSKESWLPLAKELPSRYQVVAPDLPGLGRSSRRSSADYDIERQATRMAELIRKLELGQVHIAGLGIGGEIAANLASRFPERVLSVTLIAPSGIATPVASDFDRARKDGNPLLPGSAESFRQLQDNFMYGSPPKMGKPEFSFKSKQNIQFRRFNQKVLADIEAASSRLSASLPGIMAPSQLLWCDADKLRDSSGVGLLKTIAPTLQTEILSGCGHMLPEELPALLADQLDSFITKPYIQDSTAVDMTSIHSPEI
nr:alpha/beta hydrolase [uncultured bacterium]